MTPDDKKYLIQFLEGFYLSRGLNFTPSVAQFWFTACQSVPFSEFRRAFIRHTDTMATIPTPFDIMKTQDNCGAHMPPEQAWNHVPKDEFSAAWITNEMGKALGACYDSLERGDKIGARMCFLECYKTEIAKSEMAGVEPKWFYSQATAQDRISRAYLKIDKTMEAAEQKWITPEKALSVLNSICSEHGIALAPFHARLQNLSPTLPPLTITSSDSGKRLASETMKLVTNGKTIGKNEFQKRIADLKAKFDED